jgi:hypothetical protein
MVSQALRSLSVIGARRYFLDFGTGPSAATFPRTISVTFKTSANNCLSTSK